MNTDNQPLPPATPPPVGRTWVKVLTTAYCPGECCCGPYAGDGRTALGFDLKTHPRGIAADHGLVPPRIEIDVPGFGRAVVDDTGAAMRESASSGIVHLDLRFEEHGEALLWGRRWLWVAMPQDAPACAGLRDPLPPRAEGSKPDDLRPHTITEND